MIGSVPHYADHRVHLDTLLRAALRAADPAEAVRRHWPAAELADAERVADRVFVVGAGKAGVKMAEATATLLGPRLTAGAIAVPHSSSSSLLPPRFPLVPSGHPIPDSGSLHAGEAIAELLADTTDRDIVLALISGGGSALMELPVPGVTLSELQSLTDQLLRSGATIDELNCVRKHLSRIKGGGLARLAFPARVVTLILSDVIGDPLDVIASGPTVPDSTTVDEARAILERYHIHPGLAASGWQSRFMETPKPDDPIFARVTTRLIGSNSLARTAAAHAAQSLGFTVELPDQVVQGEARERGTALATEFARRRAYFSPYTIIYGGETTVTVRGNGVGGRNQELALAAAIALDGASQKIVIASFGTDGVDGPTNAAGATATPESVRRARDLGLDPAAKLESNDSHSFFDALGDCIVTGPTGTNVNDLVIVLVYPN